MFKKATDTNLIDALTSPLKQTNQHVERLLEVFEGIDKKALSKKCEAMEGLIQEAAEIM